MSHLEGGQKQLRVNQIIERVFVPPVSIVQVTTWASNHDRWFATKTVPSSRPVKKQRYNEKAECSADNELRAVSCFDGSSPSSSRSEQRRAGGQLRISL